MKLAENEFKKALKTRKLSYGLWHGLQDTYAAEICAGVGFDWVCIDGEHSPFDLNTILHHLRAVEAQGTIPLVRAPEGNPTTIKQLLDIGVQNLVIPMIETREEAEMMVRSIHYGPGGIRGVGYGIGRAGNWGRVKNYIENANDQICLILQVESSKGMENLELILEIEAIDAIFIGPADLSTSMGFSGKLTDEVRNQVDKALSLIKAHQKTAGILALKKEDADYFKEKGANMIGVGVDTLLLAKATTELYNQFR